MGFPRARSSAEAHLFMDLRPCRCGETSFARHALTGTAGGELVTRYSGSCPQCGLAREFAFALPERPPPAGAEPVFGGPEPSELLDPGEWLLVADRAAAQGPAHGTGGDGARHALGTAIAALGEVLKFLPQDAAAVPPEAFRTYPGQSLHDRELARFRRARLDAVREAYRELLAAGPVPGGVTAADR